MNKNTLLHSTI